jgi:hypothetical protein
MPLICCYRATNRGALAEKTDAAPMTKRQRDRLWKEYTHTLQWFRAFCPAAMPVVVTFSTFPGAILGQCLRRPTRFLIRLNDQMGEPQAVDTLVHEWAHALAWSYSLDSLAKAAPAVFEAASHDETWGCAYSRVYRARTAAAQAFDLLNTL